MSRTPEPRPALRRADDGSVHPAAPRAEPPKHLHAAPPPAMTTAAPAPPPADDVTDRNKYKPGDLRARKAAKQALEATEKRMSKQELATLKVSIPKKLRKAARKRAESEETTVDTVVTQALEAWLPR